MNTLYPSEVRIHRKSGRQAKTSSKRSRVASLILLNSRSFAVLQFLLVFFIIESMYMQNHPNTIDFMAKRCRSTLASGSASCASFRSRTTSSPPSPCGRWKLNLGRSDEGTAVGVSICNHSSAMLGDVFCCCNQLVLGDLGIVRWTHPNFNPPALPKPLGFRALTVPLHIEIQLAPAPPHYAWVAPQSARGSSCLKKTPADSKLVSTWIIKWIYENSLESYHKLL